jgi:hypothetical protein
MVAIDEAGRNRLDEENEGRKRLKQQLKAIRKLQTKHQKVLADLRDKKQAEVRTTTTSLQ